MKLFVLILAALTSAPALAVEAMPTDSEARYLLNTGQAGALAKARLGHQVVDKSLRVMKATYSTTFYSTSTVGFYILRDVDGKDAKLPKNAIIRQVQVETLVDMQALGPQIQVSLGASTLPRDMLSRAPIAQFRSTVPWCIYGPCASSAFVAATTYKLPAASTVTLQIEGAGLKHGKFNLWIEYLVGDQALTQWSHAKPN